MLAIVCFTIQVSVAFVPSDLGRFGVARKALEQGPDMETSSMAQ